MARPKKTNHDPKTKTIFDHITQIRNIKSATYFSELSVTEKKSFNHYMICRFLSMDFNCIHEVSYLTKVFDKMDSECFYKVCCAIIPNCQYTPYIKGKTEKFNVGLLDMLCETYKIGHTTASEYCSVLMESESGMLELERICQSYGLSDKEIAKLVSYEK